MNTVLRSNPDCCHDNSRHPRALTVQRRALFRQQLRITRCFLLVLISFGPALLEAQQQSGPQKRENKFGTEEVARTANATRVEHPPKFDGTVDDPVWQMASPITNFRQREPFEGQTPTEKTEVRVLYDKHNVYFGIHCFDSDPSNIVATQLRRDVSQELDDYFEIIIDSSHDRRNAYVFQVNPLSTQRDALITEEHRTDSDTGDGDPGWDGVWTSEARVTAQGWRPASPAWSQRIRPSFYENRFAIKFTYSWRP